MDMYTFQIWELGVRLLLLITPRSLEKHVNNHIFCCCYCYYY